MSDHVDDDRYQIQARTSLALSGLRVLKHGDTFAVFARDGDVRPAGTLGAEGVYHDGTRFLSKMRLVVNGGRLLLLSSTVRENNVLFAGDLTNPDLDHVRADGGGEVAEGGRVVVPHGVLHVFRSKFLWQAVCYERLQVSNFGGAPLYVELELALGADFVDVFEVRGTHRARRGKLHEPRIVNGELVLAYDGLDDVRRETHVRFAPAPDEASPERVLFRFRLEAKESKDLYVTIQCRTDAAKSNNCRADAAKTKDDACPAFESAYAEACSALKRHEQTTCSIYTSNEQFNAWIGRSISDLRMLISDTPDGPYPYAGVPWFSTPFGRDAIITAMETLWVNPDIARGVLSYLAARQADSLDAESDAEPGKILHELRTGEMAALREVPFGRYYGSVDATPLFVMLAGAYHAAVADTAFAELLWPHVERALAWIERYGDADGDGFFEYHRHSSDGLVQQGWKDSNDSVFHQDGTLADGPIALCEVQGYVYAAWRAAAELAASLGNDARAAELQSRAALLRERFDKAFWCEDLSTYALALDGQKRPCRVRSSNAGQCLYTGIVKPERAEVLADQLLSTEMFSGWGIRTLATCERRYNPMAYHNGSIWPHDNALIAAGLAQYGLKRQASMVLEALFDASLFVELHRLPELFCGFPRRPGEGPTLYPVACSPQAWAAASPFLLLGAVLGLSLEGAHARVRFDRPILPHMIEEASFDNLRVGAAASVDLRVHRYPDNVGINVAQRRGKVEVVSIK